MIPFFTRSGCLDGLTRRYRTISKKDYRKVLKITLTFLRPIFFILEKPPDDPKERFWYNKHKQTFARFLQFYGKSIEGGIDRAKVITVTETDVTDGKKKKGKDKTDKVVS